MRIRRTRKYGFYAVFKLTYKNVSKHYATSRQSPKWTNNEQFTKFCPSIRDSLSSRTIFPIYFAVMRLCIFSISISQLASCRTGKISVRRTRNITHALIPSIIIGHDRENRGWSFRASARCESTWWRNFSGLPRARQIAERRKNFREP